MGGWLCDVRSIHAHARTHARRRIHERARHGKHQINHLINFAEVVVVVAAVMVAAATAMVLGGGEL